LIPGIVAILGRRNLHETPAFLESCDRSNVGDAEAPEGPGRAQACTDIKKSRPSVCAFFRANGAQILIGIGAVVSASFMQYIGFVWTTSYLKSSGMASQHAELAGVLANIVRIVFTLPMGWFADVQGVGAASVDIAHAARKHQAAGAEALVRTGGDSVSTLAWQVGDRRGTLPPEPRGTALAGRGLPPRAAEEAARFGELWRAQSAVCAWPTRRVLLPGPSGTTSALSLLPPPSSSASSSLTPVLLPAPYPLLHSRRLIGRRVRGVITLILSVVSSRASP